MIISLATTAIFIAIRSSETAEQETLKRMQTASREAAEALQSRIRTNLAAMMALESAMSLTRGAAQPLARTQIDKMVQGILQRFPDFVGAAVTWEPNALDGRDADFVGQPPMYDDTGRYMVYWTRKPDGSFDGEVIVFSDELGANDWYDIPKRTRRIHFTDPYFYPVQGRDVLMATLAAPILIDGTFRGTASADFTLDQLTQILSEVQTVQGGQLALIANGGVYASHPNPSLVNQRANDMPPYVLEAVAQGRDITHTDANGIIHLLRPVQAHSDAKPWSVRLSFPREVALASARELTAYTALIATVCALFATFIMASLIYRLTRPLRLLSQTMQNLSTGDADLTLRLPVKGRDELADICNGFNCFVKRIHDVLAKVSMSTESVFGASSEIAVGNTDLSNRTEQQASSLQEIAASMEEVASSVKQNADNALQARDLTGTASAVVVRGGDQVKHIIEMMRSLNESSKKISDIIGVIDEIAFQTNILALNAAVEAARAGENGRGFAVVANEVRALASRSAEAAKEIKLLITASVTRIEEGGRLVEEAGMTMGEVVNSIELVAHVVGEIANSSAEQSLGVTQVGDAITHIDQNTQQNAALVEETAAAAASLRDQAEELKRAVSQFTLHAEPMAREASSRSVSRPSVRRLAAI